MKLKSIFIITFICFLWTNKNIEAYANKIDKNIADNNVFIIEMSVKAEHESIKQAQKKAVNDGMRQAFYQVISKLTPENARDIYRNFVSEKKQNANLAKYLKSYTINREFAKSGSYQADVTYRFDKDKLKQIPGIDTNGFESNNSDKIPDGNGLLIVPLYNIGNQMLLFEQGNQWRYALNDVALEVGQGDLVMPFGDVRDQQLIDSQSALAGDKQKFIQMAKRYGTRNVVIAVAKSSLKGLESSIEVLLYRAGVSKPDIVKLNFQAVSAIETLESLLQKASYQVAIKLRKQITDYSLFGQSEANKVKPLVVRAEYITGSQWRYMLSIMRSLPNLERLEVGAVGLNSAQATIFYTGDLNIINSKMLGSELQIDKSNKYWLVTVPISIVK